MDCIKKLDPTEVKLTGNHMIIDFDPQNGHLPESKKKLVTIETSDGLESVGSIWVSGDSKKMFMGKFRQVMSK